MNRLLTPLCRRLYLLLAVVLGLDGGFYLVRHSGWYKERLYRQLIAGDRQHKVSAAADLLDTGGQAQLVRALRSDSASARELAANALWELWFHAAGDEAYRFVAAAQRLIDRHDFADALLLLNHVVKAYPGFAEGWNRRATLYWLMGDYRKSIADCRRVLGLNPSHFGAWQGMGLCQLEIGDVRGACRSLRAACQITPYDLGARQLLQRCEEMLRQNPARGSPRGSELI
ncbi:MAG: hypothetical protein KGS61_03240 [Verrucomicrobia bacterium]|nr:hypothetical protein [Verrucomicrobiota bacterium]